MHPTACLTRVITDDDCGVEIAQLRSALQAIESELVGVPGTERHYIAEALLNLAMARLGSSGLLFRQTLASTRALRVGVSNAPWRPYTFG